MNIIIDLLIIIVLCGVIWFILSSCDKDRESANFGDGLLTDQFKKTNPAVSDTIAEVISDSVSGDDIGSDDKIGN